MLRWRQVGKDESIGLLGVAQARPAHRAPGTGPAVSTRASRLEQSGHAFDQLRRPFPDPNPTPRKEPDKRRQVPVLRFAEIVGRHPFLQPATLAADLGQIEPRLQLRYRRGVTGVLA